MRRETQDARRERQKAKSKRQKLEGVRQKFGVGAWAHYFSDCAIGPGASSCALRLRPSSPLRCAQDCAQGMLRAEIRDAQVMFRVPAVTGTLFKKN
ncbi:MAG: hypothetical protein EA364_02650 [Balneolaceae bacterium]|nr:MAG: hypothetical protein EA364_02650 [Balneolaceae bacterium]